MKKLLWIMVLGLVLSGNAYTHNEDKFVYLVCQAEGYSNRYSLNLDFKKKTVSSWNESKGETTDYKIYNTSEEWIKAKMIDNENERIIIHRFLLHSFFQELKDDYWKEKSRGSLICEKIKKKF